MKKLFKYSQFLTLGVFLLSSSVVLAASKQCYSPAELNDFKTLYIKLQNELNYEGKDAYLDKKYQVKLRPHSKDKSYPGREFEAALFGEYQNSIRKIGKLYQSAKFENDDSFKSNEVLVNFMKAIDDKSTESEDFISKTKIKDVINALEEASQKKYAKSADKKFMINAGDKYLLEKLLTHAQDRVCSVNKFEETNKGTALFKADYLKQVKNAPLNILVNTIKNAPIGKDSKIDLRGPSDLTASLIDQDVAVQSAVADNLNQLSAWIKKVKAQGPKCLASIKSKDFANKIQANIQGCNFGRFVETLSQDNVSNLESVLHFINANEKLLNNPAANAETSMDELKLEGFISKTFDNLGTAVRCTQLDPANSGDKKIFIRNLPYDEKSNKFDTSGIICKSNSKILGAETCRKQFDLSSDSLGRGLEIKAKKGTAANVTFSVKDSDNCSDISLKDPKTENLATSPEQCTAQLKDGSAFVWDTKNSKCNEVEIANVSSIEQCVALKKEGSVFNWDAQKKSCGEFSALLTENVLKQSAQQCSVQKKNGYSYKWDSAKNSCDETPTMAGTKLESKISCDAKTAANLPYKWNASENACESSPVLTAADIKAKVACETKPAKSGFSNSWDNQSRQCGQLEVSKVPTIEQCVALKKPGSVFNWDADKKSCGEFSSLLLSAALKQSAQQCEVKGSKWNSDKKDCEDTAATSSSIKEAHNNPLVLSDIKSKTACDAINKKGLSSSWDNSKGQCSAVDIEKVSTIEQCIALKKEGSVFNWDAQKNSCGEFPALANANSDTKNTITASELAKVSSLEQCVALKKPGSVFNWSSDKNSCEESSSLLKEANLTQAAQQCTAQKKYGYEYKWDSANKSCSEIPTMAGTKLESKIACDAKTSAGLPFKWNSSENSCERTGNGPDSRSPALSNGNLKNSGLNYESQTRNDNSKTPGSKIGDSKDSDSSLGANSKNNNAKPADSKNPNTSMLTDSKNGIVKSGPAVQPSLPADLNEKMAKMACESKSSPGNAFRWNSSSKHCEGSTITSSSNGSGKTPIVKPIVLTTEETKPAVKNPNPPTVGSKGPGVTNEELKTKPDTITAESKTGTTTPPAIKSEDGNNASSLSNLQTVNADKVKAEVTKAQMDCEINRGPNFSWDSVKETCNEVTTAAVVAKPAEEDASLAEREKSCIADNDKWIKEENDGRPGIKFEWDDDKKDCINKRPDKDGPKKVAEETGVAEEAVSVPKRAPARFTPINIPSRQIYLMPGMP